jgi:hypothetical protein
MSITREDLIALVAEYEALLERVAEGDLYAEEELEYFLEDYPGIPNYDSRGNFIGSVSNENGWTP